MDEDIYKSDELIENPFENNKENRLADKALWLIDDQEDNNKEFTIDQFADFAKKAIILVESLNPKSVPIAYQYIHLLRFQTPFKNENIALYVCNKMDETSSSFADCLIDLLEATHNYILINGNDNKSFILFETIEQCFTLQEDILALIASLSIHSTEISRYFLNLEIIDLITNNFLTHTHNSLINSYRVIYGMIGEYRFLNKSAFLYDDENDEYFFFDDSDMLLKGKANKIVKIIPLLRATLLENFTGYQEDNDTKNELNIEEIQTHAMNSITQLPFLSYFLSIEAMTEILDIVLGLFQNRKEFLRYPIIKFLFHLSLCWDETYPKGFEIFPPIINIVLAEAGDDDRQLIYYALLLVKSLFQNVRKKSTSKEEFFQQLASAETIDFSLVVKYMIFSECMPIQIASIGAINAAIQCGPTTFDYVYFTNEIIGFLKQIMEEGDINVKRAASVTVMKTIKYCCVNSEEYDKRCELFLNAEIMELLFEIIDTLKEQKLTINFAYMLDFLSNIEGFSDVMDEIDGIGFLEQTLAFGEGEDLGSNEQQSAQNIIENIIEKLQQNEK